jgi:hypothetical protein
LVRRVALSLVDDASSSSSPPSGQVGIGGTVWDAAIVLIMYLNNPRLFPNKDIKEKTIIELGAGTGAVGISLALQGLLFFFLVCAILFLCFLFRSACANRLQECCDHRHQGAPQPDRLQYSAKWLHFT